MTLAICTQMQELIFCNNIINITPVSGVVENTPCYALYAKMIDKNDDDDKDITNVGIQLGVYDTEERLFEVLDEIKKFIASGVIGVYEMPIDSEESSL